MPPIVSDAHKENRKKEILNSAFVCFAKKGFQEATINDIVEHSGISKGAIYNYFKSKDEIYLELMSNQTVQVYENKKLELSKKKSAIEKLNSWFDAYLEMDPFLEENKAHFAIHIEFKLHASRNPELLKVLNERRQRYFVREISEIITEGQMAGEIKQNIQPEVYADLFWSVIDGVVSQTIVYKDYPYNEALNELKEMYLQRIMITS
ncbi:TetR/AcrR family transcriptional regulator [Neobacillus cucumis]|uniref:TetR/AcrR family transcriptional regulator n=1 Tax=Neobacillus cucumis TaxID=1740721 RepID=UPI0018E007A8|nr:TetR/AcrR family transcriptional regulator [Neobacillus cucumis]MBI0578622.1 TetR/AcrR family transcriptional regulator [Neobacillus cucumis]